VCGWTGENKSVSDFKIAVPESEASFTITQTFKAPRELVWECYTRPEHMVHFWGPHGSTTPVCEVDLRPGGIWRTVMRFESGQEYGYTSVYLAIEKPERLVYRDAPYDWTGGIDGLPPCEIHSTILLIEATGKTVMELTVRAPDIAHRDGMIERGFGEMVRAGNERLDSYLATLKELD
jgi:uncharacterized protein YndB with AHSA1/START domain